MRGLFEKDIRLLLTRKSSIYIFIIIGVIFTWEFYERLSGAYITMLGILLALSTLSYDDSDKCMEFILTLPCTRTQYVLEKYIFVYGFAMVSGLLGLIITFAAAGVKGSTIDGTTVIEIVCSILPIIVLGGGIMIPLQIKFGSEKTRIVLLVAGGVFLVLGFMASKLPGMESLPESLGNRIAAITPTGQLILLLAIIIFLSVISIFFSIKIINTKEY